MFFLAWQKLSSSNFQLRETHRHVEQHPSEGRQEQAQDDEEAVVGRGDVADARSRRRPKRRRAHRGGEAEAAASARATLPPPFFEAMASSWFLMGSCRVREGKTRGRREKERREGREKRVSFLFLSFLFFSQTSSFFSSLLSRPFSKTPGTEKRKKFFSPPC